MIRRSKFVTYSISERAEKNEQGNRIHCRVSVARTLPVMVEVDRCNVGRVGFIHPTNGVCFLAVCRAVVFFAMRRQKAKS